MNSKTTKQFIALAISFLSLGLSLIYSEKESKTINTIFKSITKGEVLFDEVLPHQGKKIGFAHGSMEKLNEGGVRGMTNPKYNGHAANYAVRLDHEDSIYEFEVRLEGDSYGGIKVGYHMASCTIKVDSIGVEKNMIPAKIAKDTWHSVKVIRVGTMVSLQVGDYYVEAEEPKLKPMIDAIRLSVKGEPGSVSYRNLKIWKVVKG